jgi:hypothetical protein
MDQISDLITQEIFEKCCDLLINTSEVNEKVKEGVLGLKSRYPSAGFAKDTFWHLLLDYYRQVSPDLLQELFIIIQNEVLVKDPMMFK